MLLENFKQDVFVHYSHKFKGRGGWIVECNVNCDNVKTVFTTYTTDSMFIDKLRDMRDDDAAHEDIQMEYHNRFFHEFEERIIESFKLETL